nr:hypothetical protein [Brenneria tiliae]
MKGAALPAQNIPPVSINGEITKMRKINYQGTTVNILDDDDMLTNCAIGSYAVIEDSGYYVAVRIEEKNAPAIHTDPFTSLEEALDEIAVQCKS